MIRRSTLPFLTVLLALGASGCFAIADLDRFESEGESGPTGCDVNLNLEGFVPHVDQLVDVRVVTADDNRLRARAIFETLGFPNMNMSLPNVGPEPDLILDFFADANDSGSYEPPPTDHSWREFDACNREPAFPHNFDFVDLPAITAEGRDLRMQLSGMQTNGGAFELRAATVVRPEMPGMPGELRTVGLYRKASVDEAEFVVEIPGIVPPDRPVEITFWQDGNGNGTYDAPPVDEAWRLQVMADRSDSLTFERIVEYIDISFTLTNGTN